MLDPAIFGLLPRPYPASLNMSLSAFTYSYAVTGVRLSRGGNIGPALIDIRASETTPGYIGANLGTSDNWVFRSPMSWHPGGKKAMWVEATRGTPRRRIQIVELPDYRPGVRVNAAATPDAIPFASTDLAAIPGFAEKTGNVDVKVYGRRTGLIVYRRSPGHIEKTYANFSDDGKSFYHGKETQDLNPRGNSTYVADIRLTGATRGRMNLKVTYGPLGGARPARLSFDRDANGVPLTHGFAEFAGKRLNIEGLEP